MPSISLSQYNFSFLAPGLPRQVLAPEHQRQVLVLGPQQAAPAPGLLLLLRMVSHFIGTTN